MLKRRSTLIFFICFLLSTILWIFNTLSKKTVKTITQEIHIIEIPPHLILDSLSQKNLEIKIEGYGFEMFQLFFNTEEFNIQYSEIENGTINLNSKKVSTFFPNNVNILDINPNKINCSFSAQKTKKVPINIDNIKITCKSPYKKSGAISIDPDSILISGSTLELEGINEWKVQPIVFENVDQKIDKIIYLEKSHLINNTEKIKLQVNIDKFTESEIKIPIKIINKPEERNIDFTPKSLKIKYLVATKNYKKVSENDFQIIVDWKDLKVDKREIQIKDIIEPDYIKIVNMKKLENEKISIWENTK